MKTPLDLYIQSVDAALTPWKLAGDMSTERLDDGYLPFESETGGYGGHDFYGTESGVEDDPVIYVHGMCKDSRDFVGHIDHMMDEGYTGDELWAVEFSGLNSGLKAMSEELEEFVSGVEEYTGAEQVDIVGHSLGVVGPLYWMKHQGRYSSVDDFVGLAGPVGGSWLNEYLGFFGLPRREDLSLESGRDGVLSEITSELPEEIDFYTVSGTADFGYLDPRRSFIPDAEENVVLENATHERVRSSDLTKQKIVEWLT